MFYKVSIRVFFFYLMLVLLIACGSDTSSDTKEVPVSDAGKNQLVNVTAGATVYLDGSNSNSK